MGELLLAELRYLALRYLWVRRLRERILLAWERFCRSYELHPARKTKAKPKQGQVFGEVGA